MEIVKKNIVSIIFGVVCLLAVISLYYPIDGLYAQLSTFLDQRSAKAAEIQSIIDGKRQLPPMSPDQGPTPLTVFPSPEVIATVQGSVKAVHDQADRMLQKAIAVNHVHTLLVPGCLPNPDHDTMGNFSEKYVADTTDARHWMDMLNATSLPTQQQIDDGKKALKDKITSDLGLIGDAKPSVQEQQSIDEDFKLQEPGVPASLQMEFSQKFSIYVGPNTLTYNRGVIDPNTNPTPTPAQIWDAQLSYWLLDDICAAINNCNLAHSGADARPSNLTTIANSPIKRISSMTPPTPIPGDVNAGANGAGALPVSYPLSPTGRTGNSLYDAYSFKLDLIVDAAKLQETIDKLEEGRFLTVNNVQVEEVVDLATEARNGYRYGNQPCLRVLLDCEMLEMRAAFADMIPDARKNGQAGTIAQAATGAPAPNTPAPAGAPAAAPPAAAAPAGGGGQGTILQGSGTTVGAPPGQYHPTGSPPGYFIPIPPPDDQ